MPELPEVETIRLGVEPVMARCVIARVLVNRHDLRGGVPLDFAARVSGAAVHSVARRGKYMLVHLSNGLTIVWHLGMSGRVRLYADAESYVPEAHDHVIFDMEGGGRVVFCDPRRFGMLYLLDQSGWEAAAPFCRMGPEPMGNGFSGAVLYPRLQAKRSAAIKAALLDQDVVAGLGNIYVCEALFRTGVSPFRPAAQVTEAECERLAVAVRAVLQAALDSGGSSLRDYKQADGAMGYFQHQFDVYDREGAPCSAAPACGDVIRRAVQAGRSTFYCPSCQKQ